MLLKFVHSHFQHYKQIVTTGMIILLVCLGHMEVKIAHASRRVSQPGREDKPWLD